MSVVLTDTQRTTTMQFEEIPVTLGTATEWRSIYYLPIYNLISGEIIQMYSEGQIRNDLGYNIELAQCLELRTSVSGGEEPLGTTGGYTGVINGWDVDSTMHYGRFSKSDSYIIPTNVSILYLVMRLRCRSTGANTGDYVIVNDEQGLMYYNRFSPQ